MATHLVLVQSRQTQIVHGVPVQQKESQLAAENSNQNDELVTLAPRGLITNDNQSLAVNQVVRQLVTSSHLPPKVSDLETRWPPPAHVFHRFLPAS